MPLQRAAVYVDVPTMERLLWSEIRVRNMVINGIITETEYVSIIGKEYESQVILLFYLTVELRDLILKVRTYESQISQVFYV